MSESVGLDLEEIGTTDTHNQMNQTHITQPLLVLAHYLIFKQKNYDIMKGDMMIGHSLG